MNQLPIITDCHGCGACCSYMGYPPFLFPWNDKPQQRPLPGMEDNIVVSSRYHDDQNYDWPNAIPPALLAEVLAAGEANPMGQGPCIWLDLETRRCRHYEHRPKVCRNFTPGDDACRRVRWSCEAEGWTINDEKHDADKRD